VKPAGRRLTLLLGAVVVRAMRERNAERRARVEQRLASLRRTADALRAQQR